MRALISKHLLLVCVVMAACAAATLWAWSPGQSQTEASPAPPAPQPEYVQMPVQDLVAMGLEEPPVDPDVACLQSHDGYAGFQTVAKGLWSAFGWCKPDVPEMTPCLLPWPPVGVCLVPSRPAFESVIRDWCVWEDFWAAHSFDPATRPPFVDFSQYLVIAVVLGERPTCGYEVIIDSIHLTHCGATVGITECLIFDAEKRTTNPFHFVKIPISCIPIDHTVTFDHHGLCIEPVP